MEYYDNDAECAVIGAMMENGSAIHKCIEILKDGNAFVFTPNRIVYQAIVALHNAGNPCDIISVASKIKSNGELNRVGGVEYIRDIVLLSSVPENLEYYTKVVRDLSIKRKLLACRNQIETIVNDDCSIEEIQNRMHNLIYSATADIHPEQMDIKHQSDIAHQRLKLMSEGKHIELSTGFPNFDLMTFGFQRKKYYIIAGLASVGKSAFIHNILYHVGVEQRRPAVLFCYESDAPTVILRMVSLATGIDLQEHASEAVTNTNVLKAFKDIQNSPLMILDDIPCSVEYGVAKTQGLKVENPDLSLVVFDHLHQMTADVGKYSNKEYIVSTISGKLKQLAKTTDIPVVALCQLSRASIHQQNQRPMLNDLRDSGALEFGADMVAFVYRDDYYEPTTPSPISETEIIIRKNKDGPIGTLHYNYYRATSKFVE